MKTRVVAFVCLCLAASFPSAQAGETFQIDPGHAHVRFSVGHFDVAKMTCTFGDVSGTVDLDTTDMSKSSVSVLIKTESLHTENPERLDAVRSAFFLSVVEHPEITFTSTSVEKNGEDYTLVGDLTIRGITKEVSFPFTIRGPRDDPFGKQRLGVIASVTVDRRDFGIKFDRKLPDGAPLIGYEVEIYLAVEASQ